VGQDREAGVAGARIGDLLLTWSNVGALILLIVIASLISPYFLNSRNILRGASMVGIVSIGMTVVILSRGIDLSVGSLLGVAAVVSASLAPYGIAIAGTTAVLAAGLLGLANGLLITKLRLQPFIATVAMLIFARGLVYIHTNGSNIPVHEASPWFTFLGSGYIGPIPVPIIVFALVWLVVAYVLRHTQFGRHVYAVGANEEAARLFGIDVDLVKIKVYALSGLLAGLAGVVTVSRLTVAEANAGQLMELDAIAATLIGGTTFDGGVGGVNGTILGVLILALLGNILNLVGVSPFAQMLVQGTIIVVAVVVSDLRQRRRQ
jgi:ribose/xylose/arabinose/galactoside ABC-type transport system permease subunit